MAEPVLHLDGVSAGWGGATVLHDVTLAVAEGEVVALLGRNGVGKTTLLATTIGATRMTRGCVRIGGVDATRLRSERRATLGLGWVPQERNIFRSLTVAENLTVAARPGPWTLPQVVALFPRLAERAGNLGGALSGGEQQMLAIGRALLTNPRLLLLDEPLEGLAPTVAADVLNAIRRITRDEGLAALLVEQHAARILPLADRAVILERGRIVHEGSATALLAAPEIAERHLGLAAAAA